MPIQDLIQSTTIISEPEYSPEPWERQIDENWRDYELFCRYRDALPVDRKYSKLARLAAVDISSMKKVSKKNNWEQRLSLYQQFIDREKREMAVVEREKMYERQIALSLQMHEVVSEAVTHVNPEEMSPNDIAKWAKLTTDMEIRARGEPTERVENTGNITVNQINKTAVGVILDDEASKLACDLLEQLASRPSDASRIRPLCDRRKVDVSTSSSISESKTS